MSAPSEEKDFEGPEYEDYWSAAKSGKYQTPATQVQMEDPEKVALRRAVGELEGRLRFQGEMSAYHENVNADFNDRQRSTDRWVRGGFRAAVQGELARLLNYHNDIGTAYKRYSQRKVGWPLGGLTTLVLFLEGFVMVGWNLSNPASFAAFFGGGPLNVAMIFIGLFVPLYIASRVDRRRSAGP